MVKSINLYKILTFLCFSTLFFINLKSSANEIRYLNQYQIIGEKNFITDYEVFNVDGTINAVIEIPSGTNEKWEVTKDGKIIEWEFRNGQPRIIDYLNYPANYGFIPRTYLPESVGGDGDALDILVLGPVINRGRVVKVKIMGMMEMYDNSEIDNKIIAATEDSEISRLGSINKFERDYPGLLDILKIWFTNYKSINTEILGFVGKTKTIKFINQASSYYQKRIKQ